MKTRCCKPNLERLVIRLAYDRNTCQMPCVMRRMEHAVKTDEFSFGDPCMRIPKIQSACWNEMN